MHGTEADCLHGFAAYADTVLCEVQILAQIIFELSWKCMKVKELIEKLKQCPEDLDVHISLHGNDIAPATGVIIFPFMYEDSDPLYVEIFNDEEF